MSARLLAIMAAAMFLSVPSDSLAQNTKNILILYMGSPQLAVNLVSAKIFQETLGLESHNQIFEEYLDENRLEVNGAEYAERLRLKYESRKMDLIISWGPPALRFLLGYGEDLWPKTPKVFSFVDYRQLPDKLPADMTGVVGSLDDMGRTLDLAIQLEPDTQRVFYIGGSAPQSKLMRRPPEGKSDSHTNRLEEIQSLNDLPLPTLLYRLSQLPSHSIVIFGAFFKDITGRPYIPAHICPLITAASSAPVYASYETVLGCGIVGGSIINVGQPAHRAADLGFRILRGEAVTSLPPQREPPNNLVVDWKQLKKWNIPEDRLPTGTIILHREPSPWERYKKYVLGIITIILAQCALIALLILQVRRRKRSEGAIRQLSRRLLTASEDERKHIARELHDDIGQRISLVAIDLAMFDNRLLSHNGIDHSGLNESRQQLDALISDIHLLSHELHSSKLEHLGLAVTLRELSRQITNRHGLTVNCETISSDVRLSTEISLCFYRIAQEALANIVKHSHATQVQLTLSIESGKLVMTVKDNGIGFDHQDVTPGLGLVAMQERLGMIGGTLSVVSRTAVGTQIVAEAKIPLSELES